MEKSGWNMYVFRGGRRVVRGRDLLDAVVKAVSQVQKSDNSESLLAALLAAGELECALADYGSPFEAGAAEATDSIALQLLRRDLGRASQLDVAEISTRLQNIEPPENVEISVHEGFAYYALHPLKFAHVVSQLSPGKSVGVVGIRSIGVALSAVTRAALQEMGVHASRITVRPTGHPYDRFLEASPTIEQWVKSMTATGSDAQFLVVDEGPGLSGSSFIATAECMERAGAPARSIVLIGTRVPDPQGLRAPEGASRWQRFKSISTAPEPYLPEGADVAIGGGVWRSHFLGASEEHPASWTQLEGLKYLSADGQQFLRFEGYGHFGEALSQRARKLSEGEFSPKFIERSDGFGRYELLRARPMTVNDLTSKVLERLAEYCAFRVAHFAAEVQEPGELEKMMRFNWENEFQSELPSDLNLAAPRPIITDSKMSPYEWLIDEEERLFKTDAVSHGDNHFFPGPCDVAWDLAGAIIEWRLSDEQAGKFLMMYQRLTNDDPRQRIGAYKLAYAVFRFAYAMLAARAMGGTVEEPLFLGEYRYYRQCALDLHAGLMAKSIGDIDESIGSLDPPLGERKSPAAA